MSSSYNTILGTDTANTLLGSSGSDSIVALAGDDTVILGSSVNGDIVNLGDGNDQIQFIIDGTSTSVAGGNGNDSLFLTVGLTSSTIAGGSGNDTFFSSAEGSSGDDWVSYASLTDAADSVNVLLYAQSVSGSAGIDSIVGGIRNAIGGAGNDTILGSWQANTLYGGAGDDYLSGVGGAANDYQGFAPGNNDVLYGEAGNDILVGTDNNNVLDGGTGNDTLDGRAGNDSLFGGNGDDSLDGGDGADTLSGGAGNDWLNFGAGDDRFSYQTSDGFGNETLDGGGGSDTLDLGVGWSSGPVATDWTNYQRADGTFIYTRGWETVVCFAEGTRIVTPNGEDAVENLRAGDMVLAMRDGQAGFEALRWVGFMDVAVPRNAAMAAKTAPILIKAGAIAPGMPARDLRVSPDHAMEVDGHLIPAKHLVNGSSIIQEVWCKRVRYFHLELEAHGLLLSEGTWSESYLDDGNRHAFNNTALTGLFLDFEAGRSQGQYDQLACLPVLRQGLKLDEIHGRIALRAAELAQPAKGRRWG